MSYFVYENDRSNYTLVHWEYCGNQWVHKAINTPTHERDRRWRGPYPTIELAETVARRTRAGEVRRCKVCLPSSKPVPV